MGREADKNICHVTGQTCAEDSKVFSFLRELHRLAMKRDPRGQDSILGKWVTSFIRESNKFCLVRHQVDTVLLAVLGGEVQQVLEGDDVIGDQDSVIGERDGGDGDASTGDPET